MSGMSPRQATAAQVLIHGWTHLLALVLAEDAVEVDLLEALGVHLVVGFDGVGGVWGGVGG